MKTVGTLSICLFAGILFASNWLAGWGSSEADVMPIVKLQAGDDLVQMIEDSDKSLIIDFYAGWCGPCRSQSEILAKVAADLPSDEIRIIKVDVDQHSKLAAHFNVASIPSLFVVKDKEVVTQHVGIASSSQLLEWLEWEK